MENINDYGIVPQKGQQLTPEQERYLEIKRAAPKCLHLLRNGDQYESYGQDAIYMACAFNHKAHTRLGVPTYVFYKAENAKILLEQANHTVEIHEN